VNIYKKLTFVETRNTDLHLLLTVWVYLHSSFSGGQCKAIFYFCKSDILAIQGHPRSLILVPIEDAYTTSY